MPSIGHASLHRRSLLSGHQPDRPHAIDRLLARTPTLSLRVAHPVSVQASPLLPRLSGVGCCRNPPCAGLGSSIGPSFECSHRTTNPTGHPFPIGEVTVNRLEDDHRLDTTRGSARRFILLSPSGGLPLASLIGGSTDLIGQFRFSFQIGESKQGPLLLPSPPHFGFGNTQRSPHLTWALAHRAFQAWPGLPCSVRAPART